MALQPADMHTSQDGAVTSAVWDLTLLEWILRTRNHDIGDVADAAATDHTSSESMVSLLKGLLRLLRIANEGIAKAEDAEAFSGDAGVMSLAVRRDTPGTGVGADNDYTALAVDSENALLVKEMNGPHPVGATPVNDASGNVANSAASATLPAVASVTNYITGFEITAAGATAAAVVTVTVTGILDGTLSYTFVAPAGVTAQATPLIVEFPMPIPASAVNTAIVVSCPALGAGNTNATAVAHGFYI